MASDDDIVITGFGGRYPECANIAEFQEALFKGIDLVTEDGRRFPPGIMGISKRAGKIEDIDKFDAGYFNIHAKQANFMEPRQRLLCETVYEAIVDAGYNPQELRGSKTGVYVGMASFNSTEEVREKKTDGYSNIGLSLAIAANRASYSFDLKGPSYTLDTACSSSIYGLVNAINDIKLGHTEAALVCGANINLHPHEFFEFHNLNMLSRDGKCKVFDKRRDGYARSEAVLTMFIQKRSKARRVYATILGAKTSSDGFKNEGITYPSTHEQLILMREVMEQTRLNPLDVTYIEAHGTGTPVGDIQECEAIMKMFCENRKEPLLMGAVKSNMGHAEMASGICSIIKTIIVMETGIIPANIHIKELDTTLPGIKDNKLKVVMQNTRWDGNVAAINSFGFGGANAHVLVKAHPNVRSVYQRPKHRLVHVSGRTEEAVKYFLDGCVEHQDDHEFLALVDELHKINFKGHNYRGYAILGEKTEYKIEKVTPNRPIWFVYSGMGSQWQGMGKDLMQFEVFRNTMFRCAAALKPYNVDLIGILTKSNANTFDDLTNCFCAISAVAIGLTDLLTSVGIVPDGIAGHSLGENGCAYADGNLTPEEAILMAYGRAYGTKSCASIPGQMAAIGLGLEECQKLLPEGIFVACVNGANSCTISGPAEETRALVERLTADGVFARLVPSGGIAFHTKYIYESGQVVLDFLKGVLKNPKPRSPKWVSSSVPPEKLHLEWTGMNCPEYHYNNYISPVRFEEVYKQIPSDAIIIEVAPHGLLQAILKRETGPNTVHIPLANRTVADNEKFFLSAIGKIFTAGGQPNLRQLYTDVKFPVSKGTTKISQFMKWDHSTSWFVPYWMHKDYVGKVVEVDMSDENNAYLFGHDLDGRVLMPATGYLELVWKVFADMQLAKMEELPIIFENVKFQRATVLPHNETVSFLVNIMKQSGMFEIFEGGSVVVSGRVYTPKEVGKEFFAAQESPCIEKDDYLLMKREDLYKECRLRRYFYKGLFQGVLECDVYGKYGRLEWMGNFTSFLDTMLHLMLLKDTSRDLSLPTFIQQVTIDPVEHLKIAAQNAAIIVTNNMYTNIIRAGGVEIAGLEFTRAPRRVIGQNPIVEKYRFIHYDLSAQPEYNEATSLNLALQIVLQNLNGLVKSPRICEVFEAEQETRLTPIVTDLLKSQPLVQADYVTLEPSKFQNVHDLVLLTEDSVSKIDPQTIRNGLSPEGFVLFKGKLSSLPKNSLFRVVYQTACGVNLLRPNLDLPKKHAVVHISINDFGWLEKVKSYAEVSEPITVYLVSDEEINGLVGFLKSVLTEPYSVKFRAYVLDGKSPKFSTELPVYKEQMRNDVAINVLREGQWGSYLYLSMEKIKKKLVENAAINVELPGDLSTITWIERPIDPVEYLPNSLLVYPFYCSLNFKDIMVSTAKIQSPKSPVHTMLDMQLGLEYSGVTEDGRRVMGTMPTEGLSLKIRTDRSFTWEVPDSWSLEEAATVPIVYSTSYYALLVRGKMRPGESVLIHAGTGGVGMAAINISLSMGCNVFTTVSTTDKKEFLKKMFPSLKVINIGNSRNKSFETMVMNNTKGKGVDLVLNSLASDLFQASLRCVGEDGRFLEIGKVDFFNGTPINSKMFLKNCSFHGILLDNMVEFDENLKKELHCLLAEGLRTGVVKPLPVTVFKEDEVEDAFRFLSSGKHRGKVVVQVRKEEPQMLRSPQRTISAVPKISFSPKKSYVLVGGLGGMGLELTNWMITRGASKIVLNSRRDLSNGYQSYCMRKWSQYKGVIVKVNTSDTTNLKGTETLIKEAAAMGPVGGIYNLAVVLRDALLIKQTKSNFEDVSAPKISSAQNLDQASRKLCPELDHFVMFSSLASGRGNIGQTNYAMANSALEMLCEKRRKNGLPALAVQYGPIADVGLIAAVDIETRVFDYLLPQGVTSCIDVLETFMLQNEVITSSFVLSEKNDTLSGKITKTPAETVAHILGIKNLELVDKTLSLMELGLDSLMLAEIKQALYRNFQLDYSVEALKEMTMHELMEKHGSSASVMTSKATVTITNGVDHEPVVLVPREAIVTLNTDPSLRNAIFLVHPIQGHIELLRPLAAKLKTTVYGLQCTKDVNCANLEKYADFFVKRIRKIQSTGPYQICAYSFGVVVAMEMCVQLQKRNEKVELIALDGAPDYIRTALMSGFERSEQNMVKAKAAMLHNFATNFKTATLEDLKNELDAYETWEEQLKLASKSLAKQTGLPEKELSLAADMFANRCIIGYHYRPTVQLKGKLLLIRRHDNPYDLPEDYNLQQFFQQQLEVVKIPGDHQTILKGSNLTKVANAITEKWLS